MYRAYRDEATEDESFWNALAAKTGQSLEGDESPVSRADMGGRAVPEAAKRPERASSRQSDESSEGKPVRTSARRTAPTAAPRRDASGKTARAPEGRKGSSAKNGASERKRKLRRGRRIYLVFLGFWVVILLVGGAFLWRYTGRCLQDYEKSQVENNVERLLQEFVVKAKDGSISRELEGIPKLSGEFESEEIVKEEYLKKLAGIGQYTCRKNEKSYSTTKPVYDIIGDGQVVANMKLTSFNPRRILAILEVCDWKIEEVIPILSETNELHTANYTYTVPEGYTVTVNGRPLTEAHVVKRTEPSGDQKLLLEYTEIPANLTYRVKDLLNRPEVIIADAQGNPVEYTADEEGNINIPYTPKTGLEMPQDRYDLAVKTAEKWSEFMCSELGGNKHGLAEIRTYLVKDSLLYKMAEEYATGIDITFISLHDKANNIIENRKVDGYTEYSENCFSVSVSFLKRMKLTKTGRYSDNPLDSTFYFVYIDQTDDGEDNPKWLLLEMISNTKSVDGDAATGEDGDTEEGAGSASR